MSNYSLHMIGTCFSCHPYYFGPSVSLLNSIVFLFRVSLRGQPDEDAVLCTRSKTYAVKFVGTSNSVFLVPPSNQFILHENPQACDEKDHDKMAVASVIKVVPGTMELVEVAPRLDKLKKLLSEKPYKLDDDFEMDELDATEIGNAGLYSWEDLIDRVQASDEELRSALQAFCALEIEGYWRIVDEKYMDGILNMLLHNSLLNSWSLGALDEAEVVRVLASDGFPHEIAHHCLQVYGNKIVDGSVDGRSVWELDERRVCVHFARGILREGKMKAENFMENWTQKVPSHMKVSFDMLEGEVLTESLGFQSWVYAFSVSSLPSNPSDRFARLFQERPKWEWKDLRPYIRSGFLHFN